MNPRLSCLGAILLSLGCHGEAPQEPVEAAAVDPIARGEYMVTVLACGDCHTPFTMGPAGPEPDLTRMLSGHPESMTMPSVPPLPEPWLWAGAATNTAFSGPWGVSYATNLTPEEVTGMGIWTKEMFVNAMKTGRAHGRVPPHRASHALARVLEADRRGSEGGLRLPSEHPADPEPGPGLPGAVASYPVS